MSTVSIDGEEVFFLIDQNLDQFEERRSREPDDIPIVAIVFTKKHAAHALHRTKSSVQKRRALSPTN